VTSILSVSLPDDVRAVLDAEATRQRRSRSAVVSEAVRAYVTGTDGNAFTKARDRTLREGLALSPADRVRLSEDLWRELGRGRAKQKPWSRSFATFAEFERWLARPAVRSRKR
jgi:predicted transcriptional regulator